ncbi:MAG: ABC transporter substrate-binding protein [Thermoproteota archaeon]
MRLARSLIALATIAVLLVPAFFQLAAAQETKTIVVGALLPLTGDLSDYGVRAKATLEVGVEDVNRYLEEKGAWFRIELRVEDTGTNPDMAVQKLNALIAQGIKFVIGPMTSAELKKVKDIATSQNVLLISPSSTALELKIPGDNAYRFCPADDVQSKAVVRLAKDLGAKGAVLIIRADTWGQGLKNEIVKLLEKEGIEYKTPLEYNPESPNFGAIAAQANSQVEELVNKYGADKVVVILIAFKEAADLFKEAATYEALRKVVWIGSDGTAKLATISEDPVAREFGKEVLFINPIFSPAETKNQEAIAQKVEQKIGDKPDAYSYAAYDALWAIALSLLDASPSASPDELVNHVKQKLEAGITNTDEFGAHSATGKFPLDDGGDRATADYDWWLVYDFGGKWDWYLVGKYLGNEDKNVWLTVDGKKYPDLVRAKFAGEATTTAPPATSTATGTPTAAGLGTGAIAAIAVVVIIVIVAAAIALRRR